jgi:hypothetical protein
MGFKISNSVVDEVNRECLVASQHATFETVSSAKMLNALIPLTKVILTGSYTVTLPNGEIGDRKTIIAVSGGGSVTVNYNNGWGGSNSINLGTVGDTIDFIATTNGWHNRSWLD